MADAAKPEARIGSFQQIGIRQHLKERARNGTADEKRVARELLDNRAKFNDWLESIAETHASEKAGFFQNIVAWIRANWASLLASLLMLI